MNQRQIRIIRAIQWLTLPIALAVVGAFALDFADGSDRMSAIANMIAPVGDGMLLVVTCLMWFTFAALVLEFVRQELAGARRNEDLGDPVLSLSETGGPAGVLLVVFTLAFAVGANIILFRPGLLAIDPAATSIEVKLVFALFYAIAHFLVIAFTLRMIRNRPYFVLTRRGFLYAPGDLSPGLVRWEDVTEIAETELLGAQGTRGSAILRRALLVTLKHPDKYLGAYNPLLKVLDRLSRATVRAQTGGKSDLVLLADDFGRRYEEVKEQMYEYARLHGAKIS